MPEEKRVTIFGMSPRAFKSPQRDDGLHIHGRRIRPQAKAALIRMADGTADPKHGWKILT